MKVRQKKVRGLFLGFKGDWAVASRIEGNYQSARFRSKIELAERDVFVPRTLVVGGLT